MSIPNGWQRQIKFNASRNTNRKILTEYEWLLLLLDKKNYLETLFLWVMYSGKVQYRLIQSQLIPSTLFILNKNLRLFHGGHTNLFHSVHVFLPFIFRFTFGLRALVRWNSGEEVDDFSKSTRNSIYIFSFSLSLTLNKMLFWFQSRLESTFKSVQGSA